MPATRSPLAMLAMLSLLAHSSALSIDALYSLADTHASSHDHDHDLHFYGPHTHSHTHSLTHSHSHLYTHLYTQLVTYSFTYTLT